MKKSYESPKAEKTTFNYCEAVVASGECHMRTILDDQPVTGSYCTGKIIDQFYTDKA